MGSAATYPLSDNGHTVRLVGTHLDGEIIECVKSSGYHPTLARTLPDGVTAFDHTETSAAVAGADFLVSGVNSYGVRWAAETLADSLASPLPIIAVTKGLEAAPNGDLRSLTEVFEDALERAGGPSCNVSGIGGPCIAGELAARRRSCVVFAAHRRAEADWLASQFRTGYYHVSSSDGLYALEIAAALKNAYTVPVGIAAGLLERPENKDPAGAQMHNLAAAVFAQGVHEIGYVLKALDQPSCLATSLTGAGDYYVTCAGGRNLRLGCLLGSGKTLQQALQEMAGVTVESLSTVSAMADAVPRLHARAVLERSRLPLMEYLIETVASGTALPLPLDRFFTEIG